jgi:hypothetical protein
MEDQPVMTRRAPTLAALAAALILAAGCGDSRTGGPDGMRTPGDNPTPDAKPTNPSSPDLGGPSVPASK